MDFYVVKSLNLSIKSETGMTNHNKEFYEVAHNKCKNGNLGRNLFKFHHKRKEYEIWGNRNCNR